MGALMTAILMTGRTGAAFAAQLGSMQVNDEIDALKTMGFSEMEFLVVPRMLALILMMPLLCVYSDLLGMAGGGLVSISLFDISMLEYSHHILRRLVLHDFMVGVGKSAVFGVICTFVALYQGYETEATPEGVAYATTRTVVMSSLAVLGMDFILTALMFSTR